MDLMIGEPPAWGFQHRVDPPEMRPSAGPIAAEARHRTRSKAVPAAVLVGGLVLTVILARWSRGGK